MALTNHSTLEMEITTIIVKRKSVEFSMHLTKVFRTNIDLNSVYEKANVIWNDSMFTVSFVDLSDSVEICIQVSNWKKR